jgi:uncharacterized protein
MTKEEYKIMSTHTKSFYEKLLLLKDKMNTESGKTNCEKKDTDMEGFLSQFMQNGGGE